MQSLVRDGILKGIRGPRGGYELARERNRVTVNDILRATGNGNGFDAEPSSELMIKVVVPVLAVAEQEFGEALSRINLEDMAQRAERLNGSGSARERDVAQARGPLRAVHDLDSFGANPLESKVERFA